MLSNYFAFSRSHQLRLLRCRQNLPGSKICIGMNNSELIKAEIFASGFLPKLVHSECSALQKRIPSISV